MYVGKYNGQPAFVTVNDTPAIPDLSRYDETPRDVSLWVRDDNDFPFHITRVMRTSFVGQRVVNEYVALLGDAVEHVLWHYLCPSKISLTLGWWANPEIEEML